MQVIDLLEINTNTNFKYCIKKDGEYVLETTDVDKVITNYSNNKVLHWHISSMFVLFITIN